MKQKIKLTGVYSYKLGNLPKGCQLCVKGEKLVLVVTGICANKCYYCPLSDQKKNKDLVWANEWCIEKNKNIVEEAVLCSAKGAGFTGGDPLFRLERTIEYIQMLKQFFGKTFHIHLYTPMNLVTKEKVAQLYKAGLDEIRFHPDIDNKEEWEKIKLALKYDWVVGVEIPVIPGKKRKIISLIKYIRKKVKFLNLNELEISDANANTLVKMKFKVKDQLSYAVKGSEELALQLLKYCSKNAPDLNVHYCTATLKDKVQLANRIKKRAKNIAKKYEKITNEGTIVRGIIYLNNLKPGFGCRKSLQEIKNNAEKLKQTIGLLENTKKKVIRKLKISKSMIDIDSNKLRLTTSKIIIKKNASKIKSFDLAPAIVEEYPTYDALEVDVNFL